MPLPYEKGLRPHRQRTQPLEGRSVCDAVSDPAHGAQHVLNKLNEFALPHLNYRMLE